MLQASRQTVERRGPLRPLCDMLLQDQPDAKPGQRAAAPVEEHWHGGGGRQTSLLDELVQEARGFGPDRTDPFFPALTAQQQTAGRGHARGMHPEPLESSEEGRELIAAASGRRIFSMGVSWRSRWVWKWWHLTNVC